MLNFFLFVVGFLILIKGADWLVIGSSCIAKKNNISDLVVGLTIVSMGTSMPELLVNILASSKDASEIAVGNILGSNIANILLILGITSFMYPIKVKQSTFNKEIPFSIVALLLVGLVANISFFDNQDNSITHLDGLFLIVFFGLFIAYIIGLAKTGRPDLLDEIPDAEMNNGKAALYIILGVIGLFFGGKWVVDGAIEIARLFQLSEAFIGLTIVAIGTSLPELVTSAMAAYRKNTDIAMANVIGSNIFNLLWVLGVSAIISPLNYQPSLNTDMVILLFASALILIGLKNGKPKNQIGKTTGILFLILYVAYLCFLIYRG
ncbi:calcium/sodium antiporter [Bacteroidia bacterium]|nr:calcium/sodium antiporter [Bacteroidia bacterium]